MTPAISTLLRLLHLREARFVVDYVAHPIYASYCHGRHLRGIVDRTHAIGQGDILAIVVLRNDAPRIPYFLRYYRGLGVDHFLFVDNGSTDGFQDLVAGEPDCSVWYTEGSYKRANLGEHWVNYLLRRHGSNHWCLRIGADEFLVYPHYDTRNLRELTAHLDETGKPSFSTLLLDMYPRGPLDEATYTTGQDPLEICPWFDPHGYCQWKLPTGDWWIEGGVRRRVFYRNDSTVAPPALNRFCLVKWRRHYSYISSTHFLTPRRLNQVHYADGLAPTGCLLYFKHFDSIHAKVVEKLERNERRNGSAEYVHHAESLTEEKALVLWNSASVRFNGWQQCVDLGLMSLGLWF